MHGRGALLCWDIRFLQGIRSDGSEPRVANLSNSNRHRTLGKDPWLGAEYRKTAGASIALDIYYGFGVRKRIAGV
jgi:hypothetical protein